MNGYHDSANDANGSPTHLGKRKRSESPEKKITINGESAASLQQRLKETLQNFPELVDLDTHFPATDRISVSMSFSRYFLILLTRVLPRDLIRNVFAFLPQIERKTQYNARLRLQPIHLQMKS